MKRTVVLFACLVLLAVTAAACGKPANEQTPAAVGQDAGNSASADNGEGKADSAARLFKDKFGEHEIPADPQRIVAISGTSLLVELGVIPAGAADYEVKPVYYLQPYADRIQLIGESNYESVLALNPDLILISDLYPQEMYDKFSEIAPTVAYSFENTDIYEQLRQVGKILGKESEAEAWISGHMEKAGKAREQVRSAVGADETVAALWINKGSFQVMGNRNIGHVLYDLLGLKPPPAVQRQIDQNHGQLVSIPNLSLEMLPQYDADRLVVLVGQEAGAEDYWKSMQQSSLWKGLKGVRNNKVYVVPYEKWWPYTVQSSDALLDDAAAMFAPQGAADK